MAKNNVISQTDMIDLTYERLVKSGINLSKSVLELAIRGYNEVKFEQLTAGASYEESRIGVVVPSWRKISKAFNPKEPYTPKVVVQMDPNLKETLHNQLKTSPDFRKAVGAEEL